MRKRKCLALILAAAMIGGSGYLGAGITPGMDRANAAEEEPSLLAEFTFDDEETGFSGGQAKASGGHTLTDSYEANAGKALHLDGTANQWLAVTNNEGESLLTGVEELTISYDIKNERTQTNWAVYAAQRAGSWEYGQEHYIGFLHNGGNLTVERYNNTNGSRPSSPSAKVGEEWTHVDAVLSKTDTTIYINGVEKSSVESAYMIPELLGENSILQIGKADWGSGEYTQASMDNLKIYGQALSKEQIEKQVPDYFANQELERLKNSLKEVVLDNATATLPNYEGMVTWKSSMPQIVVQEDGCSVKVQQPANGEEALKGTLTAVLHVLGRTEEVEVPVTIKPQYAPTDQYGYLMVHFVEDSQGYAEKIYLDISRGDNPEQWDPLNGRKPILTSNLGTTGVRDPFITYNPETQTYYIIATDLRVFGGDNAGWGEWQHNYSTKMNVWESKDLITWSDVRQFDVVRNMDGEKLANLGMMWAPETTWVEDYYGEGKGAFVVYWTSHRYADEAQTQSLGADIMWGVTTDFTQETWEFGGMFLEGGNAGWIDTNIIRDGEKTYHITKSNAEEIIMEVTTAKDWWNYETTEWTRVQSHIGQSRFGAVEGPASFKDHSQENRWYLFVDDLPTPGYQPMISTDLSKGFEYLDSPDYFLTTHTKHGGVISLTKAQYDAIRNADAVSAVQEDLGVAEVEEGTDEAGMKEVLPKTAEVNLAYNMGTSNLPVVWDTTGVDTEKAGTYDIIGTVQSISANKDQWVGKDGSTSYLAEDKELYSSAPIQVTMKVQVKEKEDPGVDPDGGDNQGGDNQGGDNQGGDNQGGSNDGKPDDSQNTGKPGSGSQSTGQPAKKPTAGKVKTGDTTDMVVWMVLLGVCAASGAAVITKRKRS